MDPTGVAPQRHPVALSLQTPHPHRSIEACRGEQVAGRLATQVDGHLLRRHGGEPLLGGLALTPVTSDASLRLALGSWTLPPLCSSRLLTGLPCPGCGLTRGIVLLLHGNLAGALAIHPFSPIVLALALLQIPPRLAGELRDGAWVAVWDRAWLRGRLEADRDSPYVLAASGGSSAGYQELEEELDVRLRELTRR